MQPATSAAMRSHAVGGTVLIVEDNPDATTIYSMVLVHSGLDVLVAADGEQGLALARASRPDVILMDIAMPGLDGLAVTRLLKGDEATALIPIVVLTAHALPGDRERALAAGADEYHTKPIEPRAVRDVIERVLRARAADPDADSATLLPLLQGARGEQPRL